MKSSVIGLFGAAALFGSMGCSGGPVDEIELGTVSQKLKTSNLNLERYNAASCSLVISGDDFQFVWGGTDNAGNVLANGEIYDEVGNLWATGMGSGSPLVAPQVTNAKMIPVSSTQCLMAGGFDGTDRLKDVYLYDATTDAWTQLNDMTDEREDFELTLCGTSGNVLAIGGIDDGNNVLTAIDRLLVGGGAAVTVANLTTNRSRFALANNDPSTNGEFIVVGGNDGNNVLDSIEVVAANAACTSLSTAVARIGNAVSAAIDIDPREFPVAFREGAAGGDNFIIGWGGDIAANTNTGNFYKVQITSFVNGQNTTPTLLTGGTTPPLPGGAGLTLRTKPQSVQFDAAGKFGIAGGFDAVNAADVALTDVETYDPVNKVFAIGGALGLTQSARRDFALDFFPSAGVAQAVGGRTDDALSGTVVISVETL
jgi:hypothetical protein